MNLKDQNSRDELVKGAKGSFFVEAGAGTGKTTVLIDRLCNIISKGYAEPKEIVAITFTEAAASELKERLFESLGQAISKVEIEAVEYSNLKYAVEHFSEFTISTIHSFANKILLKYSSEANLPISFTVQSNDYETYRYFIDLETKIKTDCGSLLVTLDKSFKEFKPNYLPKIIAEVKKHELSRLEVESILDELAQNVKQIKELLPGIREILLQCKKEDDKLSVSVSEILNSFYPKCVSLENLDSFTDQKWLHIVLDLIATPLQKYKQLGIGENWPNGSKKNIVEQVTKLESQLNYCKQVCLKYFLYLVVNEICQLKETLIRKGLLSFDDLLKYAVELLANHKEIRGEVGCSYKFISVDEYQDTDYRQYRLLRLIVQGAQEKSHDLNMFYVGDPKQSIYGFRNANLDLYYATKNEFLNKVNGIDDVKLVTLNSNFRSQDEIIEWTNSYMTALFSADPEFKNQIKLDSVRETCKIEKFNDNNSRKVFYITYKQDTLDDSSPTNIRQIDTQKQEQPKINELREYGSDKIASTIRYLIDNKICVNEQKKTVSYQDIAIVLPTRTSVNLLTDALDDYDIPYKFESKAYLLSVDVVKSARYLFNVILDPADLISWVGLVQNLPNLLTEAEISKFVDNLRSGGIQLNENKLIKLVANYRERLNKTSLDNLVDEIVDECYLRVGAVFYTNNRDSISKLNNFVYLIKDFLLSGNYTLAKLIDWLNFLESQSESFSDAAISETDYDAVRIVTVHAAKGLEYPIVFLTGLKNLISENHNRVIFEFNRSEDKPTESSAEIYLNKSVNTKDLKTKYPDYESIRRLYVATTRTKDLLFINFADCYNNLGNDTNNTNKLGNTNKLDNTNKLEKNPELDNSYADIDPVSKLYFQLNSDEIIKGDVDNLLSGFKPIASSYRNNLELEGCYDARSSFEEVLSSMQNRRSKISDILNRKKIVTPSSLNNKLTFEQLADMDDQLKYSTQLKSSSRGTLGTRIGTAVHKVLEKFDFTQLKQDNLSGIESYLSELCWACSNEFSVEDRVYEIKNLVLNALKSDILKIAATKSHYKEVYVGLPINLDSMGSSILEGYIDLLIDMGDKYEIVDYKTTSLIEDLDLSKLEKDYERQGIAYAYAVYKLTSKKVGRVIFLMLNEKGSKELTIPESILEESLDCFESIVLSTLGSD